MRRQSCLVFDVSRGGWLLCEYLCAQSGRLANRYSTPAFCGMSTPHKHGRSGKWLVWGAHLPSSSSLSSFLMTIINHCGWLGYSITECAPISTFLAITVSQSLCTDHCHFLFNHSSLHLLCSLFVRKEGTNHKECRVCYCSARLCMASHVHRKEAHSLNAMSYLQHFNSWSIPSCYSHERVASLAHFQFISCNAACGSLYEAVCREYTWIENCDSRVIRLLL